MHGNTVVAFLNAHARCVLGQLQSCTLRGRVGARLTLRDRRRAARSQDGHNKRRKSWFQRFVSNSYHLHLESAANTKPRTRTRTQNTFSPAPFMLQNDTATAPSWPDAPLRAARRYRPLRRLVYGREQIEILDDGDFGWSLPFCRLQSSSTSCILTPHFVCESALCVLVRARACPCFVACWPSWHPQQYPVPTPSLN